MTAKHSRREREMGPDLVKGIAAVGVVAIHASGSIAITPRAVAVIVDWSMLGVPLFVIAWSYNVGRSWEEGAGNFVWLGRFYRRLIPPFLIWSLFYEVLSGEALHFDISTFTHHWTGSGWPGQYYFILLFLLAPFVPVLRFIVSRNAAAAIVVGTTLVCFTAYSVNLYVPHGILAQRWFPFYWLGYATAGLWIARSGIRIHPAWCVILPIVMSIWSYVDHSIRPPLEHYFTIPIFLSSLIIGAVVLPRKTSGSRFNAIFVRVGRSSLAVFVLNPLLVLIFVWCIRQFWRPMSGFGQTTLLLVLILLIVTASYLIEMLLTKARLGWLVK
jgi:hypothetical protein